MLTEKMYRDTQINEQRLMILFDYEHGRFKDKPCVQVQVNEAVQYSLSGDEEFNAMIAKRVKRFEVEIAKLFDGKIKDKKKEIISELDKVEGLGTKTWDELIARTYPTVKGGVDEEGA